MKFPIVKFSKQFRCSSLFAFFFGLALLMLGGAVGCAQKPLVKGFFDEGGTIYRASESEEWGSRSAIKVQPLEF